MVRVGSAVPGTAKMNVARQLAAEAAGSWFGADLVAELRLLNARTLQWLRAQARGAAARQCALLGENLALWLKLDDRGARELSHCPCALIDAEFANGAVWESIATAAVRDAAPACYGEQASILLGDAEGRQLASLTVHLAWHLARHRPAAAAVTLGMSAATARQLQGMRLAAVDLVPAFRPALVRPRWQDEPRAWTMLLAAAISGDPLQLESARVGALQFIAGALSGPREADRS